MSGNGFKLDTHIILDTYNKSKKLAERYYSDKKFSTTFEDFAEKLGVDGKYAYSLARIGHIFAKKHFLEYGIKRLVIITQYFSDKEQALPVLESMKDLSTREFTRETKILYGKLKSALPMYKQRISRKRTSSASKIKNTPDFELWDNFPETALYSTLHFGRKTLNLVISGDIIYGKLTTNSV